jgi:hypothetical protein
VTYPPGATGDVFRRLEASGFDFQSPHDVDFFAIFPTEEAADAVARQYVVDHERGERLVNIETRPATDGGMELELVKAMLVTYDNVSSFEAKLGRRTAEVGGRLDGWGVWQEPSSRIGRHIGANQMKFKYELPPKLVAQVVEMREFVNGGTQVTIRLRNGGTIPQVLISMSKFIVAVRGYDDLPFKIDEIAEIYQTDEDKSPSLQSGWKFWDDWKLHDD